MAYGLKYTCAFDALDGNSVEIKFLQKDYVGASTSVIAGGDPLHFKWPGDDPLQTIKGCTATIILINNGAVSIADFYSATDDGWMVEVRINTNIEFVGFIVQDDCRELGVDYAHELLLTATDNLGLLKDYKLSDTPRFIRSVSFSAQISSTSQNAILFTSGFPAGGIAPGSTIVVAAPSPLAGSWIATETIYLAAGAAVGVFPTIMYYPTVHTATITLTQILEYNAKLTIREILTTCLARTGLSLPIYWACEIQEEVSGAIYNQLLDIRTLMAENDFRNCYDILELILARFHLTLFQAHGRWYIMNLLELRHHGGDAHITPLNADGTIGATFNFQVDFAVDGSQIVFGLDKSILRPIKFAQESFTYKTADKLLLNADLQELGTLIRTYTNGLSGTSLETYKEYIPVNWSRGWSYNSTNTAITYNSGNEIFIRVTLNYKNDEIDRYLVTKNNPGYDDPSALMGVPVEVSKGDKIKFGVSYKTENSVPGSFFAGFKVILITQLPIAPAVNAFYWKQNGTWALSSYPNINDPIEAADDSINWHSVDWESFEIPMDGLLYVFLPSLANRGGGGYAGTYFKSITFDIESTVIGQKTIKGHTHTADLALNIRDNDKSGIEIDDTISNSIFGTLFKPSLSGIISARTEKWKAWNADTVAARKLGNVTTVNLMQWRGVVRRQREGEFIGLYSVTKFISPFEIIILGIENTYRFAISQLDVDVRNGRFKAVLTELYVTGEANANYNYEYKYITNTK